MSKENNKKHKCIICGHEEYQKGENPVQYTVDPYNSEILGDYTKDWYCTNCYNKASEEI